MKCKVCGKTVYDTDRFCPYCGGAIDPEAQETTAAYQPNKEETDLLQHRKKPNETTGGPAPQPKKKKWVIPLIAAALIAVLAVGVGIWLMINNNGGTRAEIQNGIVQIDQVSVDFGTNAPADGEVRMRELSATEEEENLGIVGKVYELESNTNYDQPVTLTMPLPEDCTGDANESLQLVVMIQETNQDGLVRDIHFYAEPQILDNSLVYNFVPTAIMESSDFIGQKQSNTGAAGRKDNAVSKVDRSKLHIKYGIWRGIFTENDATATMDGGHFILYISHKDAVAIKEKQIQASTAAEENSRLSNLYKYALNLLEDAYEYYYADGTYRCLCPDELFPLPVYFSNLRDADGIFCGRAFEVGHPYMELNSGSFLQYFRAKEDKLDAAATVYHEMFHCVQRGYDINLTFNTSPFYEATATYYESKILGDIVPDNYSANVHMSYSSLFGDYGVGGWINGAQHDAGGYGRLGLVQYISDRMGSDEWIAQVLERGGSSDAMAEVLTDYKDWALDYYLSQTTGLIPCKESRWASACHIYHAAENGQIGDIMTLTVPGEEELQQWQEEQDNLDPEEREPLVLGEESISVNGQAAQVLALKVEIPEEAVLPEDGTLTVSVNKGFRAVPIHLHSNDIRETPDLQDLAEDIREGKVDDYYEILVFSEHDLDDSETAEVKVEFRTGLTYDDILGSYEGTITCSEIYGSTYFNEMVARQESGEETSENSDGVACDINLLESFQESLAAGEFSFHNLTVYEEDRAEQKVLMEILLTNDDGYTLPLYVPAVFTGTSLKTVVDGKEMELAIKKTDPKILNTAGAVEFAFFARTDGGGIEEVTSPEYVSEAEEIFIFAVNLDMNKNLEEGA